MGFQQGQGRGALVRKLVDYHGYKVVPATKIVNQVVALLVKALKEGKDIEIPGLGTLEVREEKYKPRRQIVDGMKSGRSVFTLYKNRKTIRLNPNPKHIKED